MRKTCYLIAAGLLAALTVLPAQAQWYDDGFDDRHDSGYDRHGHDDYGYGYNSGTFRCESRDRRTTRCPTRGDRVQLIRQYSDMPCVRGRSWGQDRYGVWVTNGCRALFRFDDRGNWGWNDGWNNGGHYGGDFVRCESRDNRSRTCPMSVGRRGDIRLVRQLSSTPCIEGRNWGRSRSGVWVSGGCRAEFVVTRGRGRGWGEAPDGFGALPSQGPRVGGPARMDDHVPVERVRSPIPRDRSSDRPPPQDGEWRNAAGGGRSAPPRPISVAQSGSPTLPPATRPGMFETVSEPSRPKPEPRLQEEAARETP
jgi:hypothetical protein